MSILSFITPELANYYEQVISIVKILEKVSGAQVVIYGGFIRSMIQGVPPRDVDLWFTYTSSSTPGIWRRRIRQMIIQLKFQYPDLNVTVSHLSTGEDAGSGGGRTLLDPVDNCDNDKYEIATININGIDFDFCCNTSGRLSFDTLTDFSVNNLYMSADGQLKTRVKTAFTVSDIITHIQNRKLLGSSIKKEKLERMVAYGYAY